MTLTQFTAARASRRPGRFIKAGSVFLLIVGAGAYSFDARMNPDRIPAVIT